MKPRINTGRVLEWFFIILWAPIGFTLGIIIDLWQVWIIRVRRPKFAWVSFKGDEKKLLETLQSYFSVGKTTPKDVLLFSKHTKIVRKTYATANVIIMQPRAWTPSPWRFLSIGFNEWIVTFEFNEALIHISNNPYKNVLRASALLAERDLPDVFQSALLTNIKLLGNYVGP